MDRGRITLLSEDPEDTLTLGSRLGSLIKSPQVLCFIGEIGSGKTLFIKGLVHAMTLTPHEAITSPTFGLVHYYEHPIEQRRVKHFDLYRMGSLEEFIASGFEDELSEGVNCIEWPEKIFPLLVDPVYIRFVSLSNTTREITLEGIHEKELLYPFTVPR